VPGFWITIGDSDVKYHAWGDGYEDSRPWSREDGFAVFYTTPRFWNVSVKDKR